MSSTSNFNDTKVDSSNLGVVWERVAQFVKKITGEVNVTKDGTLQSQVSAVKETVNSMSTTVKEVSGKVETLETNSGGLEFGISDNGCLTVTYDDGTDTE